MGQFFSDYGFFFAICYLGLVGILSLFFAILFHEAGHAFTAYLFTRDKVDVFVGSFGNKGKSVSVKMGVFHLWILKNPFKWRGGLCVPAGRNITVAKRALFILAGPVASLLLSVIVFWALLYFEPQGIVVPFFIILSIISFACFLGSIVPVSKTYKTASGRIFYNDGAQLLKILKEGQSYIQIQLATGLLSDKKYDEAIALLEPLINKKTKNVDIYRVAVVANTYAKNYDRARYLQEEQKRLFGSFNVYDRINEALLKTLLHQYDEAIGYYKQLLQTDGDNEYNLNNLGFTLTVVERFEEAIPYLDKAIALNEKMADAYANRGYARIKTGLSEEGKADIEQAITMDATNSYAHRNMGIYFYERGLYDTALKQLRKAKALDADTLLLDEYFKMIDAKISEQYQTSA